MFYVINSPNFAVKSVFFPNFGQGPFPKIAGKSPALEKMEFKHTSLIGLFKKV